MDNTEIMDTYCANHNCDKCTIIEELKNVSSLPCDRLWDLRSELIDKVIEYALWYLWGAHIKVDQEDMGKYIRKMVDLEQRKENENA